MSAPELHLWEIDHPYYASDGCYYTPGNRWDEVHSEWESWADFLAAWDNLDLDLNLLYRWDWQRADPDYPDDYPDSDALRLFFMLQRKAKPFSHYIAVKESDEPAIREWLTKRAEHMRLLWEPLLGEVTR